MPINIIGISLYLNPDIPIAYTIIESITRRKHEMTIGFLGWTAGYIDCSQPIGMQTLTSKNRPLVLCETIKSGIVSPRYI